MFQHHGSHPFPNSRPPDVQATPSLTHTRWFPLGTQLTPLCPQLLPLRARATPDISLCPSFEGSDPWSVSDSMIYQAQHLTKQGNLICNHLSFHFLPVDEAPHGPLEQNSLSVMLAGCLVHAWLTVCACACMNIYVLYRLA